MISVLLKISGPDQTNYSADEADELMEEYYQLLIPNHSELWRINNSVLSSEDAKPSRYFGMDYMKVRPGMEYAYQMMEDEGARPFMKPAWK
jgi:hypothetical protein